MLGLQQKIHRYWPAEKNQPLQYGRFTLTLQSAKQKQFSVERIITVSHKEVGSSGMLGICRHKFDRKLSFYTLGSQSPIRSRKLCMEITNILQILLLTIHLPYSRLNGTSVV